MLALAFRRSAPGIVTAAALLAAGCDGAASEPGAGEVVAAAHDCQLATDPCDDGNPCTADSCDTATSTCLHVPIANCCTEDTECSDDKPCTSDRCNDNVCVFMAIDGCIPDAGRLPEDGGGTDGHVDGGDSAGDGSAPPDGTPPAGPDASSTAGLQLEGGACALATHKGGAEAGLLAGLGLALVLLRRRRW